MKPPAISAVMLFAHQWAITSILLGLALLVAGLLGLSSGTVAASGVSSATVVKDVMSAVGTGVGLLMSLVGSMQVARNGLVQTVAEGNRRHSAWLFRYRWPATATRLGWVQTYETGKHIPKLSKVVSTDDKLTVICKPLAKQPRESWPTMAEQLRRDIGASAATAVEDKPGILKMELALHPLPNVVPFDLEDAASSFEDGFKFGRRVTGGEVLWKPAEVPHLLVSGATQGGKGGVLRLAAVQALSSGWDVLVANPKMSGEFGWIKQHYVKVVADLDDILGVVRGLFDEVQRRQRLVDEANVASWVKLDNRQGLGWKPKLFIVDEAAVLLTPNKANKEMAAKQTEIGDLLARMAMIGRAVGVHLILATQRPDASSLGPAGGPLRNNIEGRIVVCTMDTDGLRMMFGSSIDGDTRLALDGTKGRALSTKTTAGDNSIEPFQVYLLDEDDERLRPLVAVPHEEVGVGDGQEPRNQHEEQWRHD